MNPDGFFSFGNMSIDDLVFADGTTRWCVPGGNAVYAALGMAVWGVRRQSCLAMVPIIPSTRSAQIA